MAVRERQKMACLSRMFGGLRTSDLHTITWEHFETSGDGFTWGIAPRRKEHRLSKGGKPQRLWVPELLRPILRDWWERAGRPAAGPVFPKRRGDEAGTEGRKKSSHAKAFRRDLGRAFGLESWDAEQERWRESGRAMTARERVILTEADLTLPVRLPQLASGLQPGARGRWRQRPAGASSGRSLEPRRARALPAEHPAGADHPDQRGFQLGTVVRAL